MTEYNYAGDIITMLICALLIILLHYLHSERNSKTRVFELANIELILACISNILFHYLMNRTDSNVMFIYLCHDVYYLLLILLFSMFTLYLYLLISSKSPNFRWVIFLASLDFVLAIIYISSHLMKFGFYIDADRALHINYSLNIFSVAYISNFLIGSFLLWFNRKHISKRIYSCLLASEVAAVVLMCLQSINDSYTYTSFTFVVPVIVVFILIHDTSIDADTGCLNASSFIPVIEELTAKKKHFYVITLRAFQYDEEERINKLSKLQMQKNMICHKCENISRDALLFNRNKNTYTLLIKDMTYLEIQDIVKQILEMMSQLGRDFSVRYKLIYYDYIQNLNSPNDIKNYEMFLEKRCGYNSTYSGTAMDKVKYDREKYILSELNDIYSKCDLDDSRVLVYCQPILDLNCSKYRTAESLMRLDLNGTGIVFPDEFIPLAEDNGLLHHLSLIILAKVSKYINTLVDLGYDIDRISINFSTIELIDENFSKEIEDILSRYKAPYDKIAIEITESTFTDNYERIEQNITYLKSKGIIFYLDDFGTGYSNFGRIAQFPFTVIKFDRSLLNIKDNNIKVADMVKRLSAMFKSMDFKLLFEGIEDGNDEQYCRERHFDYAQGYKYSKPIPIEQLQDFLSIKQISTRET